MNQKQWIAILIGFLSLLADSFAAAVNYLDYRLVMATLLVQSVLLSCSGHPIYCSGQLSLY